MYLTQSLHRALQQVSDRPMTVCGDRTRTTREVVDRVARLAGALRGLGVAEGDRIGILALNSDRYHEFLFAAWWVGAVAHPINTRWSPAEITYALEDSGTQVLFVDDAFAATVPELPALRVVVHCGEDPAPPGMLDYEQLIETFTPASDLRRGDNAVAALLYTGGTTGFPKGVMLSHRAVLTSAMGALTVSRAYDPGGVTLVAAPLFHSAALASCTAQALVGGTGVFVPRFDASEVLRLIDRHRITSLPLVSTMIEMLCEHPDAATADVSCVRTISYGAAPMSETALARAMRTFPQAGFSQVYGMTEAPMITVLSREDHASCGRVLRSAGRSTPHAGLRIVDPAGEHEVPRGTVGEIVTRGDHLMSGYWNRPDETATAMRGGWMHTGDLGHMDANGYVYVVDRLKDMIISGGENVYSSEVENALAQHPAVAGCAVIGLPDRQWGERVHAAIVLRPGATATAAEIRSHAKTLIAGYKAPRTVEFLDALPMTAAGKIAKNKLRQRHTAAAADVAPSNP